jgi:hypothetical protein
MFCYNYMPLTLHSIYNFFKGSKMIFKKNYFSFTLFHLILSYHVTSNFYFITPFTLFYFSLFLNLILSCFLILSYLLTLFYPIFILSHFFYLIICFYYYKDLLTWKFCTLRDLNPQPDFGWFITRHAHNHYTNGSKQVVYPLTIYE